MLVADKTNHNVLLALIKNLHQPAFEAAERLMIDDGVAEEDDICGSIEDLCDRTESFLAGRVPNLKLKCKIFDFDAEGAKLDTNRAIML